MVLILAVMFAVAVVAGWMLEHAGRPEAGDAQSRVPWKCGVWRPDTDYQPLAAALPLRTGDELQVRIRVPAGHHVGLFSINGQGRVVLLQQYPPQSDAAELIWPAANQTRELRPPTGTEVLLACGRRDGPVSEAEVQAAWDGPEPWPQLAPAARLIRISPDKVQDKGEQPRNFGAVHDRPDPETATRRLDRLRSRLTPTCDFLEGLAFVHQ